MGKVFGESSGIASRRNGYRIGTYAGTVFRLCGQAAMAESWQTGADGYRQLLPRRLCILCGSLEPYHLSIRLMGRGTLCCDRNAKKPPGQGGFLRCLAFILRTGQSVMVFGVIYRKIFREGFLRRYRCALTFFNALLSGYQIRFKEAGIN